MNIYAKNGDLVRYTGRGGYKCDRDAAEALGLAVGKVYEVSRTNIGGFQTNVWLVGVESKFGFNSVMFEDA